MSEERNNYSFIAYLERGLLIMDRIRKTMAAIERARQKARSDNKGEALPKTVTLGEADKQHVTQGLEIVPMVSPYLVNIFREAVGAQGRVYDNAKIVEETLGLSKVDDILAQITALSMYDEHELNDEEIESFLNSLCQEQATSTGESCRS